MSDDDDASLSAHEVRLINLIYKAGAEALDDLTAASIFGCVAIAEARLMRTFLKASETERQK